MQRLTLNLNSKHRTSQLTPLHRCTHDCTPFYAQHNYLRIIAHGDCARFAKWKCNVWARMCGLPSCSEAAKRKCAACKSLGYCSREHQRSDWKIHKKECQRIVTAEAAASGEGAAGGGASPREDQAELKVQGQHMSFSCVHILSAFVCRSQLLVHAFIV